MPQLTLLSWAIWIAVLIAQIVLVSSMIRVRAAGRWPAFFTFACLKSTVTITLMICALIYTDRSAAVYFYTYWISSAVVAAIEVWMILEMACAVMRGFPGFCRLIRGLVPTLSALFLTWSLLIAREDPLHSVTLQGRFVVTIDRAATLAWLATFICLIYASDLMGVQWRIRYRRLALGFSILVVSDAAVGWAIGAFPNCPYVNHAHDATYTAALLIWVWAFLRYKDAEEMPDIEALHSIASNFREAFKSSRGK